MKEVLYLLTFIVTVIIVLSLNEFQWKKKRHVKEKLNYIKQMTSSYQKEELEDEYRKPLTERLIKPTYENFLQLIGRIAPNHIKERYAMIINNAGFKKNVSYTSIIALQIMFSLFLGGSLFLILHAARKDNVVLIAFATVFGFISPIMYVKSQADKRKIRIMQSLPDMLDLLYVSVEAGLGFDMALKRTMEKMTGPLSDEINKTLEEISRGRERQEALRGMIKRTGVEDLSYFVTSVIQTEQLGSNIANMLRIQSNTMREKRRQRAEETAMKLPIKMLFPIIFFIFPTVFIVVLGPAVLRIIDALSNTF